MSAEGRENLIQNAVRFLQDPSVQSSSVAGRISFLEKKGLNKEEIDRALHLAGVSRPTTGSPEGDEPAQANNTGSMKQLASQLGSAPPIPAKGPSTALKKLATSEGFSWSRLFLYVAVTSGLLAAIRNSPASVPLSIYLPFKLSRRGLNMLIGSLEIIY
jgi:peroxin-14